MPGQHRPPNLERTLRELHERVRRIETGATPTRPAKRFLGAAAGWQPVEVDLCDSPRPYTAFVASGGPAPAVTWPSSPCRVDSVALAGGYYFDHLLSFDEIGELTGDFRAFALVSGTGAPAGGGVGLQSMRHSELYAAYSGGFDNITGWSHQASTPEAGLLSSAGGSRPPQWYELARVGNVLGFAAYGASDPRTGAVAPIFSVSRTLAGREAFEFGLGQPVRPGVMVIAGVGNGEAAFERFEVQTFD